MLQKGEEKETGKKPKTDILSGVGENILLIAMGKKKKRKAGKQYYDETFQT